MYQVTFSDQSAKLFQQFSKERQLKLISELSALSPSMLTEAKEPISSFQRAETIYYRYRVEDLRFYFTLKIDVINCVIILNKNTWADFRLRANLEKLSDAEIEKKPNFFSLLES